MSTDGADDDEQGSGRAIDAVVFDFGGVLVDWNPRHLYGQVIEDEAELDHFLSEVGTLAWHAQHDRGVPFAESVSARQAEFPDHADLLALWGERYGDMVGGEIPGSAAIVSELRALGLSLWGLSNMPGEVWPALKAAWSITARLDGVVISGEEQLVKPDPAIFALLADRFELEPTRTAFIDDVQANVDAAAAAGFRALRFVDAAQLRADLRALGIPLRA